MKRPLQILFHLPTKMTTELKECYESIKSSLVNIPNFDEFCTFCKGNEELVIGAWREKKSIALVRIKPSSKPSPNSSSIGRPLNPHHSRWDPVFIDEYAFPSEFHSDNK